MRLSFEYDTTYLGPPFPVLELGLNGSKRVLALIDSGSDATSIPLNLLQQAQARKIDSRWASTITGARYRVDIYMLSLWVGDFEMPGMEVIANVSTAEVIVGRDVLNQLIVTLNGLAGTTWVSDTA